MHVLKIAAQAIGFAALANAARLVVVVPPSQLLPEPSSLPSSTHAVLLGSPGGARYDSLLRRDNTFVFPELALDSYLFTIYARDYNFAPLRVDVATNASSTALSSEKYESSTVITAWQTFRGNEWSNKGPELDSARDTLIIRVQPLSGKDYYQQRAGFSILSFLKNPMILMGLFSVVMIVGIPYVMDNLDPEMKAELEEMQKSGSSASSAQAAAESFQNFDLAGWMAGKSAPAAPAKNGGGGGNGKKK